MSHLVVYCTRCEAETSDDLTDNTGQCSACHEREQEFKVYEKAIRLLLRAHKKSETITSFKVRCCWLTFRFTITIYFNDPSYTDGRDERAHDTREFTGPFAVPDVNSWIHEMTDEV